jgi:hypothetical protein
MSIQLRQYVACFRCQISVLLNGLSVYGTFGMQDFLYERSKKTIMLLFWPSTERL